MLVWYDHTCMPQGERTNEEQELFSATLAHVNILYLGVRCLLLVDLSYLSRFWSVRTQLHGYPASSDASRVRTCCP